MSLKNVGCLKNEILNKDKYFTKILKTIQIPQASEKKCDTYEEYIDRIIGNLLQNQQFASMTTTQKENFKNFFENWIKERLTKADYNKMSDEYKNCRTIDVPPLVKTRNYGVKECYDTAKEANSSFMALGKSEGGKVACFYSKDGDDGFNYANTRQMCTSDTDNELFAVTQDCSTSQNDFDMCIEENNEKIIKKANEIYKEQMNKYKEKIANSNILLFEYEKGNNVNIPEIARAKENDDQVSYEEAKRAYEDKVREEKTKQEENKLNEREKLLKKNLKYVKSFYSQTTDLIGDKNRLLATKNADINNQYDEITSMDKKISTLTQDIYMNQKKTNQADNITSILRVLTIVFIVMGIVFVIYFFGKKRNGNNNNENRFTNFINNINNKINNRFKL